MNEDPALKPTDLFDDVAIKRARELLNSMPENIGPYRILERIGGGGMGEVYSAEQRSPIRRQVAIKFIKLGMDSKAVLARFEAERQALALMDHPHIAKVFDAGSDETGRPFFVMEYVKGKPITDYADQNHLTIAERLKLFEQVCQAVQHAHHKGVIHRDLKPGNVLVSTQDGEPFSKVIDFGIAKAIAQRLTEETIFTQHDQFIGTPQYMSPEQAEGNVDIDTRTDVYSLGVMLYELLTGSTPFSKNELKAAAFEQIKKMIIEVDPPKPSTRLSPDTPTLNSLAAFRRTEPKRLGRLVQGELDWIVMKAIDKDRRRRYETPTSLANDIVAHLKGEPVQAAPPSTVYRIQKFVRRNRSLVIGTSAVVLALLAGVTGTTWGLIRAMIAERNKEVALGLVTKERDAKEELRKLAEAATQAESEQREKAERQLVSGILRPIGFKGDAEILDPAELKSLADWSSLGDSRLQLLALEVAFEDAATALRVARRAERVTQSCVGLSTKRRAVAIKLVSAKQRDKHADPRFRIAACWLALELGSADLPAIKESFSFLKKPAHNTSNEFSEFVNLAVACNDPQLRTIVDRIGGDALIAVLENSSDHLALETAGRGLATLAPRLDLEQVDRGWDALLAVLEKSTNDAALRGVSSALIALAPLLSPDQVTRGWESLYAILENPTISSTHCGVAKGLKALAPRLAPEQVTSAWERLAALLMNSKVAGFEAGIALVGVVPRLHPARVSAAADELFAVLEKSTDFYEIDAAVRGLAAMAPGLSSQQIPRAWDALAGMLEKCDGHEECAAAPGLAALAPRLALEHVTRAWDRLVTILESSSRSWALGGAGEGLAALAPRLAPEHVKLGFDALIVVLEKSTNESGQAAAVEGLVALAPRLTPEQVKSAWGTLASKLEKTSNSWASSRKVWGLAALTLRLGPEEIALGWNNLLSVLEESANDSPGHQAAVSGLAVLAVRLTPPQVTRVSNKLFSVLEKSTNDPSVRAAVWGLVALAPQLVPELRVRTAEALVESRQLETSSLSSVQTTAFVKLLDTSSRDRISAIAMTFVLDCPSPRWSDFGRFEAEAMSNPRSLAKLFSHPGCVGEPREFMLQRFEELVLHNGEPVYLKPDAASESDPVDEPDTPPPPRRFHNLHAAAAWIEKNWPDFDLDGNYPMIWRR